MPRFIEKYIFEFLTEINGNQDKRVFAPMSRAGTKDMIYRVSDKSWMSEIPDIRENPVYSQRNKSFSIREVLSKIRINWIKFFHEYRFISKILFQTSNVYVVVYLKNDCYFLNFNRI